MNGADLLCDSLLANEVDVCFANPGTSEMHFVAALDRKPQMRCVLGLFEGVVTGAADGYGRMADKPAATLLHLGPGLGNGLANLHNARRAYTPMINIVGNHATYHLPYDAPLTSDIESIARPMSAWVRSMDRAETIGENVNAAWTAAHAGPGVATLILPADAAWSEVAAPVIQRAAPIVADAVSEDELKAVAHHIKAGKRVGLLLGGKALRAATLEIAAAIASTGNVRLMSETSNGRAERGAGRTFIQRIPYRIDAAVEFMRDIDLLVLVGAHAPAAFFAYPGKPSLPQRPDCQLIALAGPAADLGLVLDRLAGLVSAERPSIETSILLPETPASGPLTGEAISRIVAARLPEDAIVCDESISTGWMFYDLSRQSQKHDYLELTGGAIGAGIPLATGAAVACPDRKVICLQADGSGMYTVQGLWTQAREKLDVVTIVFSNRTYQALHFEMHNVGVDNFGSNASRMLNLTEPDIDWVSLSKGMGVEAGRAQTVEQFDRLLEKALAQVGPFLIEASI
jgi:acetolactate synthase-1/2/3 large subunit